MSGWGWGGRGSVTTVDVRAEKEGPEKEGRGNTFRASACFRCICGCFSSSFSPYFNKVEVLKAAAPSGSVPPKTFWCILDVQPLFWCRLDSHLYWENTRVLLTEQDANTSGASLSCQTTAGPRHQLSPQSTMKGGLVAGRHTSWTLQAPPRETAAPVFK